MTGVLSPSNCDFKDKSNILFISLNFIKDRISLVENQRKELIKQFDCHGCRGTFNPELFNLDFEYQWLLSEMQKIVSEIEKKNEII